MGLPRRFGTRGGRCLLAAGGVAAAATFLGLWALRAATPPSLEAIEAAAKAQRWDVVERGLNQWLQAHPDDGKARVMFGLLLVAQQRDPEARRVLEPVAESDPERGRARAMLGELAIRRHDAAAAERAFRDAASRDPSAIEPRQRLVYLLSLQQRTGEARDVLWQLYRITRDPRLLIDLVLELWAVETDIRGLGSDLKAFLDHTPSDPFLRRAWGLSLLLRGQAAEARPHLEAAATALSGDPVGRFALAECLLTLGQFEGDATILGDCPETSADASRWWVFRGRIEEARGQAEAAFESFRHAVDENPDSLEARHRLAQALIRRGDGAEARSQLDRVETIKARDAAIRREHETLRRNGFDADPETFERLGRLCRDAGLTAEARAWFEQAIRVDPTRRPAQLALADLAETSDTFPFALSRPRLASQERLSASAWKDRKSPRRTRSSVRFEEITQRSGVSFSYDSGARGDLYLGDTMGGGVGLIDFDEDGWLDIYFVNGCRLPYDAASPPRPNRLFRNRGDGTFEDVTERAGVGGRGYGMGCAVGDYDNDGHDDLFVTGLGSTVLYRNRGDGTFEDVTERAGVVSDRWTTAAGFGDLDGDGDLDLVAVTYVEADPRDVPTRGGRSTARPASSPHSRIISGATTATARSAT